MSFRNILDLNFSASKEDIFIIVNEEEGLNNHQPFDLNTGIYSFLFDFLVNKFFI